jgi:MoaA/NifB/PqqE/SkfB family radical SAM enzyme
LKTYSQIFKISTKVFNAKFFGKRYPLFVSWTLLNRCNFTCGHCALWRTPTHESDTKAALELIDRLAKLGTKFISFLGGEPLMRRDLGIILESCHRHGIQTKITTNGSMLPALAPQVEYADIIRISLDGLADIHDAIRGNGSFERAIQAAKWAMTQNKRVVLNCVITKDLVTRIDELENLLAEVGIPMSFQPLEHRPETTFKTDVRDRQTECSFANTIMPSQESYLVFLARIKEIKTDKPHLIANSQSYLNQISSWPHLKQVRCYAGSLFVRIAPDGRVVSCDRFSEAGVYADSLLKDYAQLPTYKECAGCWRGSTMEINSALNFNTDSIRGLMVEHFVGPKVLINQSKHEI